MIKIISCFLLFFTLTTQNLNGYHFINSVESSYGEQVRFYHLHSFQDHKVIKRGYSEHFLSLRALDPSPLFFRLFTRFIFRVSLLLLLPFFLTAQEELPRHEILRIDASQNVLKAEAFYGDVLSVSDNYFQIISLEEYSEAVRDDVRFFVRHTPTLESYRIRETDERYDYQIRYLPRDLIQLKTDNTIYLFSDYESMTFSRHLHQLYKESNWFAYYFSTNGLDAGPGQLTLPAINSFYQFLDDTDYPYDVTTILKNYQQLSNNNFLSRDETAYLEYLTKMRILIQKVTFILYASKENRLSRDEFQQFQASDIWLRIESKLIQGENASVFPFLSESPFDIKNNSFHYINHRGSKKVLPETEVKYLVAMTDEILNLTISLSKKQRLEYLLVYLKESGQIDRRTNEYLAADLYYNKGGTWLSALQSGKTWEEALMIKDLPGDLSAWIGYQYLLKRWDFEHFVLQNRSFDVLKSHRNDQMILYLTLFVLDGYLQSRGNEYFSIEDLKRVAFVYYDGSELSQDLQKYETTAFHDFLINLSQYSKDHEGFSRLLRQSLERVEYMDSSLYEKKAPFFDGEWTQQDFNRLLIVCGVILFFMILRGKKQNKTMLILLLFAAITSLKAEPYRSEIPMKKNILPFQSDPDTDLFLKAS